MDAQRAAFIKKIADDAVKATVGTALFPSVMIAQACLEGNNGTSVLAKKYNNHFGIKASSSWFGGTALMNTKEFIKNAWIVVKAPFRAYATLYDGFKDRCSFLQKNSRYEKAGVFKASTPLDQVKAIFKAGYATDPNYVALVNSIIVTYGLSQYDEAKKKSVQSSSNIASDIYGWLRFKLA